MPFYLGLCVLLIGVLFKIQHYPGSAYCVMGGLFTETTYMVLVIVEVVSSKKASTAVKITCSVVYPLIPIVAVFYLPSILQWLLIFLWGIAYLNGGRKLFLYKKTMADKYPFDSI